VPLVLSAPGRSMRRDLADGWTQFRSRPWLVATTVQFTLINLVVWGPFLVLGPTLSHQHPTGARDWGLIMAAYGAGAILGGLSALGHHPHRPLVAATLATVGYAAPCALFATHAPTLAIATGACLAGTGSTLSAAFADTATQHHTPPAVLARVRAFQTFGAYSLGPLAFALAGPIAATVGATSVLGFGALTAITSSALVLATPSVRAITSNPTPSTPTPPNSQNATTS
jgi:MFS family permease